MNINIETGEVWLVDFEGRVGSVNGSKPAIVISRQHIIDRFTYVSVVPITSRPEKKLKTHVKLAPSDGLVEGSTALAEQIRLFQKNRFNSKLTSLSPKTIAKIDKALNEALGTDV